ncbi:MAG: hypothetical protein RQ754_07000 [Desulfuromonadales bacterium]|nr:hypothetical protein [Desulfuromonadales bacterium]
MSRIILLVLCWSGLALTACGGDSSDEPGSRIDQDAVFVSSRSLTFTADIDPTRVVQLDPVRFYESLDEPQEELYIISSPQELDRFNQLLSSNEQLSFSDLGQASYLLLRAPTCPDWEELARIEDDPAAESGYLLKVHRFTLHEQVCAAVVETVYSLLKAYRHPSP